MKKILVLIILLNFGLFLNIPISGQRLYNSGENKLAAKNLVKYKSANAFSDGNGVWLEWETSLESGNLGFNIYRNDGTSKELINQNLIAGGYLKTRDIQNSGEKYTFFDESGKLNDTYYIETFSITGRKQLTNLISTKYTEDLTAVAGNSSSAMRAFSKNTNSSFVNNNVDVPEDLKAEIEQNSVQADINKQYFVASQPGVKIGVKKDGFYRVPRPELVNGGFDASSPSTKWQLYKDGVEQAINVDANGQYIEFYGKGIDTRDSDTQNYFLIAGSQNGKRIQSNFRRGLGSKVLATSFDQTTNYKERTIYSSDIFNGDDVENFFGKVITNSVTAPATVNLSLPAIDFSEPNSSIDITIQGVTQIAHQTRVTLNDVEIGLITGNYVTSTAKHFDIQTSLLREGSNTLKFYAQNGSSDISFFDNVKVNFAKKYQVQQNQLSFYVQNYKVTKVDGFTSTNIRVLDLTVPDEPSIVANANIESNDTGGYRVVLDASRSRLLFAFDNSAVLSPDSITKNNPSTLASTTHNANMIIISYKDWMTEANTWADYRRSQGMNVEVVNIEDVFDEFSYGANSSNAIKGFLQYAYNNWQVQPKYVFLIGDATYNPRNYADGVPNSGSFNFIPTRMVETSYLETGSDETMADFNNDGLAEISIGRIPVHDAQTVTDILNKVSIFEQNISTQNLSRGFIFASDVPNGYDFQGVSNRLRNQLSPQVTSIMVNKSEADSRTHLLTELNNGRYIINYSGHGNTAAWSSSPTLFGSGDVPNMTNGNNLSVFTLLTCLNGYFIQPTDSLSEILLKKQSGGAAAVWASTGLTTPDIQEIMATRFFSDINTSDSSMRLGDLIKNAKSAIPGGKDVRLSWALIGDPALKMK